MTALDTDVLTHYLLGDLAIRQQIDAIPPTQLALPVVVVEEILRGRLDLIRRAEAGKSRTTIEQAYRLFEVDLRVVQSLPILSYDSASHTLFEAWGSSRIRVGTHDKRIGAICVAHNAELLTRNVRDYSRLPTLRIRVI